MVLLLEWLVFIYWLNKLKSKQESVLQSYFDGAKLHVLKNLKDTKKADYFKSSQPFVTYE